MVERFAYLRPFTAAFRTMISGRNKTAMLAFFLGTIGSTLATAQTTTISGTVFDPRTSASSLPLPNVLVYITTDPVPPLPSGVQCLTYQAPAGAVSYAYSAVDGTFTLDKVPVNATYTLVIQAGKWRRQFTQAVVTDPVTGLALHMPADHTQGDIPMIAIATGSVDAAECVLLDMGIASSEFTDDNGGSNSGGHIHLYKGSQAPGAQINASTPNQSSLLSSSSTLNSYDMVMFPCQGTPINQTSATAATNLLNFANAGGRLFTTHYSYVWLVPDAPYNSQFPSVANWTYNAEKQVPTGTGTVETNFSDGATLAQWLQNSNATVPGTADQISIGTLRTDVDSVIAPTQSWVTLNNGTYSGTTISNNPVMEMTFNTPVGAPAANQCGRVMFNDYHVFNVNDTGQTFPAECPNPATHVMSAQEEMLEYALFDLSAFVQPVVVPTLDIAFNPSPVIVKQNDSADQVLVSVTNTSSTSATSSSAVLSFSMPQLLTVTSMTDSTGGWNCKVSALTCTRSSTLAAGATDSVTLTFSVGAYPAGGLSSYTGQISAKVSSVTFSTDVTASDVVIYQQSPTITWHTPSPIVYGNPLTSVQLNAVANLPGTFTYNPAAGTILTAGQHTLNVTFTPNDTTNYIPSTASVSINVLAATPLLTLTASKSALFLTGSVSFTATIPLPGSGASGSITFYDGSTQIGSGTLNNGSASLATSSLKAGTHTITAAYSGDSNYGPATSSPISVTVLDFTLTASGGGLATVLPASKTSFAITIAPVGGATLPGDVNLSLGTLPVGSSAAFSSSTVSANSPATTITLQVSMAGASTLSERRDEGAKWPMALALLLLPFGLRVRRFRAWIAVAIISAALATGISGCGGSLVPQSFTIPVNAASGGLSHSISLKITVQNNSH